MMSSFTNSILNAYIQQSVDEEGNVDWSKMPDVLKSDVQIPGIGRGGETSSQAREYEQNTNSVGLKSIMDAAIEAIGDPSDFFDSLANTISWISTMFF